MSKAPYIPTPAEEKVSFWTHLPGVLLGLVLTVALYLKPEASLLEQISYVVYGLTFMIVFAASAVYHSCSPGEKKKYYKKVDHACIYLFMAGSYTPFVVMKMLPTYQFYFLAIVWTVAIFGLCYKMISTNENRLISLFLYFTFGFMCFLAYDDLLAQLSDLSFNLLVIGAIFYIGGVIFYLLNQIPFNHAIWHIFVLIGATSHFFAVYYI